MNVKLALMATPLTSAGCVSDNAESEDTRCWLRRFGPHLLVFVSLLFKSLPHCD